MNFVQSNEVVFAGHPDRLCNQIGAAILKAAVEQDPNTRAGIEVCGGKGKIFVTGEMTTDAYINVEKIVKSVLSDNKVDTNIEIENNIGTQSPDIAQGVDIGGAGDQGEIFGAACDDTPFYLPVAQMILQDFAEEYNFLHCAHPDELYADGKAQITGVYDSETRKLIRIKTVVISYQNAEKDDGFRRYWDAIIKRIFGVIAVKYGYSIKDTEFKINPTGKFLVGGFEGDAGVLGRKLVVDGYHNFFRTSGGATTGKDATKVDFSAAIKARHLAISAVKNGAKWAEVQLSYAIGVAEPVGITLKTDKGYQEVPEEWYSECTPARMIEDLNLRKIDYVQLAKFGNFGKYEMLFYGEELIR